MEVDKLILEDWSKTTLGYYLGEVERVGEDVATSFYNQSDLSRVKNCELMIIGINPGAGCLFSQWGLKDHALSNSDFLYRGNPCFQGLSDKEIIYEMSQKYDKDKKRYGWDLWKKIHKMLGYAGKGELLEKLDRFVLTNMIFFGTDKENQIPKGVNKEKCAEQTIELISILQPKVVLLLGNQSRKLFDRVSENKLEVLVPNSMYHCMSGKCHVLAIKHTAYYYSSIEMELIGKTIGYILDHQDETMNSETIRASSIKEEIIRFEQKQRTINLQGNESLYYLKQKISAKGCNILIDHNGHLIYEYYCNNAHNKYIKANGTISIEISYDNKQCSFSLMTKGNHPEDLLKKVQETCDELKVFKNDSKDCFVSDIETDDVKIVEFFNVLLAKIKKYRETDCPK